MNRFEGFIAVVTGGAQGLGYHVVKKLVAEGATVFSVDIQEEKVKTVCAEIGERAIPWPMDIAHEHKWIELYDHIKNNYGELDILVNNAAIMTYKDIHDTSTEEWNRMLDVNLSGDWFAMKYAHAVMKKGAYRGIVNVLSTAAIRTGPATGDDAAYIATKGAVLQLTKHVAGVYAKDCIRANMVLPSAMMTPMLQHNIDNLPGTVELMKTVNPLPPHYGLPEEVADAILFLADPKAARNITGVPLLCDSGSMTQ